LKCYVDDKWKLGKFNMGDLLMSPMKALERYGLKG